MKSIYFKSILFIALVAGFASCKNESGGNATADVNKIFFTMENGELIRPKGYRTWVFVGTPVTPNDLNGGRASFPEMHNVYIDPVSYAHYVKTGKFRDGTIMMKELVSVGSTQASSGAGYFEGEYIGLEANVKSKKHFPDEPGTWAIFSFTSPEDGILKERIAPKPTAECTACHVANAADDQVFTQYYPVLRAAKGAGENVVPENAARRTPGHGAGTKSASKAPGVWDATAPSPENIEGVPLEEKKLFAWLQKGKYKKWKNQEKGIHGSLGPHEDVRAFVNDKLAASLNAGNKTHPVGVVAVKEQYKGGKTYGWSVMAKTQEDSDGGKGWFWYEVTSNEDIEAKAAIGNGVVGCTGCHIAGKDMVKIQFPFKS